MKKTDKKPLMLTDSEIDNLIGLIDGCLGASESNNFNKVFKPILKRLEKIHKPGKVN